MHHNIPRSYASVCTHCDIRELSAWSQINDELCADVCGIDGRGVSIINCVGDFIGNDDSIRILWCTPSQHY